MYKILTSKYERGTNFDGERFARLKLHCDARKQGTTKNEIICSRKKRVNTESRKKVPVKMNSNAQM